VKDIFVSFRFVSFRFVFARDQFIITRLPLPRSRFARARNRPLPYSFFLFLSIPRSFRFPSHWVAPIRFPRRRRRDRRERAPNRERHHHHAIRLRHRAECERYDRRTRDDGLPNAFASTLADVIHVWRFDE